MDNIIGSAVQKAAEALQSQQCDVFILSQPVQSFIVYDVIFQQLILGYFFRFHSIPKWSIINNREHLLSNFRCYQYRQKILFSIL